MTLSDLRQYIQKRGYDAAIITRGNMFLGQDIRPEENELHRLTGFSGSAGTLLVLKDKAFLLVDGRYELQAACETDPAEINVVCTGESLGSWINAFFSEPCKIAYNPWCHSAAEINSWQKLMPEHFFIAEEKGFGGMRVAKHDADIFEHKIENCGISAEEKISYLSRFINEQKLDAYLVTACDSVSWLLNLRSNVLSDTPILRAFALIDKNSNVCRLDGSLCQIKDIAATCRGKLVGMSYAKTPQKIISLMKKNKVQTVNIADPVENWKAVKNPVELAGIRRAHLRDGAAMVKFLFWLQQNRQNLDELGVVKQLHAFRAEQEKFHSESFGTIAAAGANGAIVHYQPSPVSNRKLADGTLLLLDSGAQYEDGTTDVTRTIALGTPTDEHRTSYTQVLKAHIAAAAAYFPDAAPGCALDALSRAQLWKFGKEYRHGTGHGVGCFLSVHEGPFSLSAKNTRPLHAGMITSIEPGYYKEESYGIRIENLVCVVPADNDGPVPMLKFEPLTLVPLDKSLIDKYLLTAAEVTWINDYHRQVYRKLRDFLPADAADWLRLVCEPL